MANLVDERGGSLTEPNVHPLDSMQGLKRRHDQCLPILAAKESGVAVRNDR